MADISNFIRENLLTPLKEYPTIIQETLVELIVERLEQLYEYTLVFPDIVTPNTTRLDILKTIAQQFSYTIRDNADIQEQVDILDNILYVYNKRGSIDTIENMWKYYGGDLPKDVQVIIPSYNLFRYNISPFSGLHVFPDGETNRTGVYEIRLGNSNYSIPKLKEFLLDELVAAGNYIYFTNAISADVRGDVTETNYKYLVTEDNLISIQLESMRTLKGLDFSGYSKLSTRRDAPYWSGDQNIFIDISSIMEIPGDIYPYIVDSLGFYSAVYPMIDMIDYEVLPDMILDIDINNLIMYSTPESSQVDIVTDLYNDREERIVPKKYFVLGESSLGETLGYEVIT